MIEWERDFDLNIKCDPDPTPESEEEGPARALAQRITGLEFSLPDVEGTKAIYRRWEGLLYPKTAQQELSKEQNKRQAIENLKNDYENSKSTYSEWDSSLFPSLEDLENERYRQERDEVIAKYLKDNHPGKGLASNKLSHRFTKFPGKT